MKPIETKYNGYRFRSRLEARWAVFFDTVGLQWEYEQEGYDLEDLGWYLPDFVMSHNPGRGPIVEIKPTPPTHKELEKISLTCALARDGAGAWGAMIWGAPGKHDWVAFHKDEGARSYDEQSTDLIGYLSAYSIDVSPHLWRRGIDASRSARFDATGGMT